MPASHPPRRPRIAPASSPVVTAPSSPNSKPGRARRRLREPERAERSRERPEEEHRLVGKRLAQEARRDVVAAFHHLLRDRRVQALVGIDQRVVQRPAETRTGPRRAGRARQAGGVCDADAAELHGAASHPGRNPRVPDPRRQVGTIADQGVGAPIEQPPHVGFLVDRPHLHGQAGAVGGTDESAGDDGQPARAFRHLEAAIWCAPSGSLSHDR